MRRETEYFSIYSLMSMRTMFFSLVEQGLRQGFGQLRLAHASGAQEQEGANGTVGVLDAGTAAEDGLTDPVNGFVLADDSSDAECRPGAAASPVRPPSSFATGMPVQRSMMRAISPSVTRSRSRLRFLPSLAMFSSSANCFFSSGSLPYFSSAAFSRSYSRSACSIWALAASMSSRSFCTFSMAFFSFSH